jgi:hypothetical protein
MYIKLSNGAIEKYPYSIGDLRKDNPSVSFPKKPENDLLAQWDVYPVAVTPQPQIDYTKNLKEGMPVNDGGWKQVWVVTDATEQEIQGRSEGVKAAIRSERDQKLADCDWTQLQDSPVNKEAWAQYRQDLRDVPQQGGFPFNVEWPTQP